MKILYQYAKSTPEDWKEIDSKQFRTLAKRAAPNTGEMGGNDNVDGWLCDLMVQGMRFNGFDHVTTKDIQIGNDEGVEVTAWNDDPDDYPVGERFAVVTTFLPVAPDPALGGALNTRQFKIIYAEGARYDRFIANNMKNCTVRPWTDFVAPSNDVLHGVSMADEKWNEHLAARTPDWGWRHWCDHLGDNEYEIDKHGRKRLRSQRDKGRYKRAEKTITLYQKSTDQFVGYDSYTNEDALAAFPGAAPTTESVTLGTATNVRCWAFTSTADLLDSADWPSGTYNAQIDCTALSAGCSFGLNGTTGNSQYAKFNRVADGLATVSESQADDVSFTATGLSLASVSWDPSAGSHGDVFGFGIKADGTVMGDAISIDVDTTDSYADGPWEQIFVHSSLTGTGTTGAIDGTFAVTKPSAVSNNDYLVAIITLATGDLEPPSGWTTGDKLLSTAGDDQTTAIFYKLITDAASEPASYTFDAVATVEGFAYFIAALTGVDTTTPEDETFSGNFTYLQNDSTPLAASVTTVTANAFVFAAWGNRDSTSGINAEWTSRADDVIGSNAVLNVISTIKIAAGATVGVDLTAVGATNDTNAGQFAFRPVVTGGGGGTATVYLPRMMLMGVGM